MEKNERGTIIWGRPAPTPRIYIIFIINHPGGGVLTCFNPRIFPFNVENIHFKGIYWQAPTRPPTIKVASGGP